MPRTSIEWCTHSWPVVNGCRRVSAGCTGCYAERLAATRLRHTERYRGLAVFREGKGPQWTGETRLIRDELTMPLRLRKPARIFVADMGDLFYEGVDDITIAAVFGVMAACPQHRFLVLTKRPERMRQWFTEWMPRFADDQRGIVSAPSEHESVLRAAFELIGDDVLASKLLTPAWDRMRAVQHTVAYRDLWPLHNVDVGVSVEDQKTADERIPVLLSLRAHVGGALWCSYEPALGPVDFTRVAHTPDGDTNDPRALVMDALAGYLDLNAGVQRRLDWIVVGGESGPGARPFDIAWARSTIEQCRAAGTKVFVKQLGAMPVDGAEGEPTGNFRANPDTGRRQYELRVTRLPLRDRKGGDMDEWPADLRVRELPGEPDAR